MSRGPNALGLNIEQRERRPEAERELLVRSCANGHVRKRRVLEPCPVCEAHLAGRRRLG